MFLKLMGRTNGDFRTIEVVDCSFCRHPEPTVTYRLARTSFTEVDPAGTTIILQANAYLMNNDGRTIESMTIQADRKASTP